MLNAYNALNGNGMITEADKGQGDRGQSYSYAAASHGDWVYIGTMYGGLGVQAILNHGMASNMGMSAEAAKNLMQTMYAGHMYLGEPDGKSAGGMLFKFNVKTGETKILMSKSAGIEGGKGIIPTFRSAFEMNGKLYFYEDYNFETGKYAVYQSSLSGKDRKRILRVDEAGDMYKNRVYYGTEKKDGTMQYYYYNTKTGKKNKIDSSKYYSLLMLERAECGYK